MARPTLPEARIHEGIKSQIATYHADIVGEVEAAANQHEFVIVGMEYNPHCRRARKALEKSGTAFKYLEYGGYTSQWKPRLALKMWTGWPTFPMVFHNGVLVGGADELEAFVSSGSHKG